MKLDNLQLIADAESQRAEHLARANAALDRRTIDPILQELYDVKAQLNAEADYSVANIVKRMRESAASHRGS